MKTSVTRTLVALPVALALGLTGCGGNGSEDDAAGPADDGAAGDAVTVEGFRFQPSTLEVPAGTTVTWDNADAINHTATAGTPEAPEATFDLDMPEEGASVSHTFDEAGTFVYFCRVHESMTGEITVTG